MNLIEHPTSPAPASLGNSIEKHPTKGEWSLEPTKLLCQALQVQPSKFRSIHITGTNGKGSVVAMVSSVLIQAGFKVGTYTSPHLLDARERILINGEKIREKEFKEITQKVQAAAGRLPKGVSASFFEQMTVAAFLYFQQQQVDFVVAEVGLGGRLDSTNLLQPLVAVITNVSIEHSELLGKTEKEIAFEKAGIIKQGCSVVTGAQGEALQVMHEKCAKENANLLFVNESDLLEVQCDQEKTCFTLQATNKSTQYCTPLLGRHQALNAAIAVKAIEMLAQKGFAVSGKAITDGLLKVHWRGRLEKISSKPLVVVDCAHNPAAARTLAISVNELWRGKELLLVCGILGDKDVQGVLEGFSQMPIRKFFAAAPKTERALPAGELAAKASKKFGEAKVLQCESVDAAMEKAVEECGENQMVLVAGSLYTVAQAMRYFEKK